MPTIKTDDGVNINYRWDGDEGQPVLIFSNSLGTNLHMWDEQAEVFSRNFRVLRYDKRGHGSSDVPPGPYSIERLGRDVVNLMDVLGVEKAIYCGLSIGGMTGMWLGANAGSRFEKLVLCNTSAHMPGEDLWNQRIEMSRAGKMEEIVGGVIERWFTADFRTREPAQVDKIRRQFVATPGEGYAGCCAAVRDMDQRETVRSIAIPTLVIAGADDPATPPEKGKLVADRIPGARYTEIPKAAHLSNIEQREAFDRHLADFIGG